MNLSTPVSQKQSPGPVRRESLLEKDSHRPLGQFRQERPSGEMLSPPSGLAFTPEGGLVVADDFNHRIQVYDRDHRPVLTFGQKGNQPGEFHYPKGVTLDAEGNFYVADSWNHRVQKLDPEGRPLLSLGSIGEGKGQLNEPYDVHLDPSGRLIVVERYNHRIQFFTPEGQSLGWVGARGTVLEEELAFIFETPGHLLAPPVFEFPTSLTRDHRGHYYLTDSGNHRIVQFDPHWREIGSFGRRGSGPGRFQYPLWIAAAPNNLLYVADLNNDCIQVFTRFGQFLASLTHAADGVPLQAPAVLAVDADGRLHAGLTFDPRIFLFQTSRLPETSLARDWAQREPANPEVLWLQARLREEEGDSRKALEAVQKAVPLLGPSETEPDFSERELLLTLGRLSREAPNESLLKQGLDRFEAKLDAARQTVLDTYREWEDAAADFNLQLFQEQQLILSGQDDRRSFNKPLYQAEKKDKTLFRKLRRLFHPYRKTARGWAQYLHHLLQIPGSDALLDAGITGIDRRLRDITHVTSECLNSKEKNEEAMVQCFAEVQDAGGKWQTFLTQYNHTRRLFDILRHVQFELRCAMEALKALALARPESNSVRDLLKRWIAEGPGAETLVRILVGYQEDPALYTTLDTLHKDLVDAWIAGTPPGEREAAWQWTENDFEPVPFNSETLDLRGLLRDRLLEGARLQKTPDGPAFGPHPVEAPGMPSPPERVVNRLAALLSNQQTYDQKSGEIFQQLEELSRQKLEWEDRAEQTVGQDPKTPITLQNNLAVVDFQIGLLRRMLWTLELNETRNRVRLMVGAALLGTGDGVSGAASFRESLHRLLPGVEEKIERGLSERKTLFLEISRLNAEQDTLDLRREITELDQSLQIRNRLQQTEMERERWDFDLDRAFKTRSALKKILHFGTAPEEVPPIRPTPAEPRFLYSFSTQLSAIGGPFRPYGLAVVNEKDVVAADHDGHRVFRFTLEGLYQDQFGGFGNFAGAFRYPVALQADGEGNLFIADEQNHRIQKFSPEGAFLLSFGDSGEPDQRLGPVFSFSLDGENHLWVADPTHHRIQIYDSTGVRTRTIEPRGSSEEALVEPVSVCCLADGTYVVGDRSAFPLKHYDREGNLRHRLSREDCPGGEIYFLTADPTYGLFASDFWSHQFLHLNFQLDVLHRYWKPGTRSGEFGKIGGLAVHGDRLFVADYDNARIQVLELCAPPSG